jgi:hypothetical protein
MQRVSSDPPASSRNEELGRQRRGSRRVDLDASVEIIHPRPGRGVTINASTGGLRVAVDCAMREGETFILRVCEALGPERTEQARVVWSRELPDGWIAGLQLIGLH